MKNKTFFLLTAMLSMLCMKTNASTLNYMMENGDEPFELSFCNLVIYDKETTVSLEWTISLYATREKPTPELCLMVPKDYGFRFITCQDSMISNTYKILEKAGLPKSLNKKLRKPGKVKVPQGEQDKKWKLTVNYFDKENKKAKEFKLAGESIYAANSTFVLELYHYFQSLAEQEAQKRAIENDPEAKKKREADAREERLRNFPKGRIMKNSYRYVEGRVRYTVDWIVVYKSNKYLVIYKEDSGNTRYDGSFTCEEDIDKVLHEIYKEGDITGLESNRGIKAEPGIRVLDESHCSFSLTFDGGPEIQSSGNFGTEPMNKATEYLRTLAEKYLGKQEQ